jgi:hypothetical protein
MGPAGASDKTGTALHDVHRTNLFVSGTSVVFSRILHIAATRNRRNPEDPNMDSNRGRVPVLR